MNWRDALAGDDDEGPGGERDHEATDDVVRTAELARLLWGDEHRVDITMWSDGDYDVQARHIRHDGSLDGSGVRIEERLTPRDDGEFELDCLVKREEFVADAIVEAADFERAEMGGAEFHDTSDDEEDRR